MRECIRCKSQMDEHYCLKVNTYGTPHIERNKGTSLLPFTQPQINVAVCPSCGEVSLFINKEESSDTNHIV